MPRMYYAAVQVDVENVDTGNPQSDKFTELVQVYRFLENNMNCGFTNIFVFDTPSVLYDLDCIISLNGEFRNNGKMNIPLKHQINNDVYFDMKF